MNNTTTDGAELWQHFPASGTANFYIDFLKTQVMLIGRQKVIKAALLSYTDDNQKQLLARYPSLNTELDCFSNILQRIEQEKCGLVIPIKAELATEAEQPVSKINVIAGFPLIIDNQIQTIVCLALYIQHQTELNAIMGHLEWGSGFLAFYLQQEKNKRVCQQNLQITSAHNILANVIAKLDFESAGQAFCSDLATQFHCDRVSLGLAKNQKVELVCLSNSIDFSKKLALTTQIQDAMLESVEQNCLLAVPDESLDNQGKPSDDKQHTKAHYLINHATRKLSQMQGNSAVLSIPLYNQGQDEFAFAAVILERAGNMPFSAQEQSWIQAICVLLSQVLFDKHNAEQPIIKQLQNRGLTHWQKLVGRGYPNRKLAVAALASVSLLFSLWHSEYWLAADAQTYSLQQFTISAPYDGYIENSQAKAGDRVKQHQILASLDKKDLGLEKIKWQSQLSKLRGELNQAQGEFDRAKINILQAQLAQAQAELDLVNSQLQRADLAAPFAGTLIQGDLSQRLGDAVRRGESLFTLAATGEYRLHIQVPESRVLDTQVGQNGRLILKSLPNTQLQFTVSRITPVAQAGEGKSTYLLEGQFNNVDQEFMQRLRPGMQGVAKIYIDERLQLSIWSRDVIEWFQLQLWRFWG
ncbi:hypothetical protein C2869_12800 [Saccharobesus litoralis]|uniref:CzcB-like barrel-sandwich hybrid domain-containing protein n=1 Tax=Saccharobesus litoralis TaxID=2172099 RepID=A0A2S0VSS3_9ALTE|nr:efflux RND transporter periplasmic adaptor subunit [Saccharobesus litoralis]AWB67264.1 hypothetical protein C2869_12800 [Saccharobesus litoralis]